MTDSDAVERDKPAADTPAVVAPEVEDDAAPAEASKPKSPARKIVLITAGVLLTFYVYQIVADRITPYTSQAAVDTFLVQIASEVTGQVDQVGVTDNRAVRKGDVLFRIDREPFEIGVRSAEANLASAFQSAGVAEVDIAVARATLNKQRVDLAASRELGGIVNELVSEGALPRTNQIRANADTDKTVADVTRGEAEVLQAQRRLGATGAQNVAVRQAMAALDQARLNLRNTTVIAPTNGVVTNLRLANGQYVSTGQPLLSFIDDGPRWITAEMRENQLGNVRPGNRVMVVLDQQPGEVFEGTVDSIGWGITQGDEAPTGQLPSVQAPSGWLREPQRFPVRILLKPSEERDELAAGRSGAQANILIVTDEGSILNPIGWLWIRAVAWASYLR